MPNQQVILAFSRGSNIGAITTDGSSWKPTNESTLVTYQAIGGIDGKCLYGTISSLRKHSVKTYSSLDSLTFVPGSFPSPQSSCVVAVARNLSYLSYSYDGAHFLKGPYSL